MSMVTTLIVKLAVTVVFGFSAGFFVSAGDALFNAAPPAVGAGAFGGPVTHVGGIEWDLAQPTTPRMVRVRCDRHAASGTSCFVAR
jgi:hypothetical protein